MRDEDASHADPLKLMEMKVKRHLKLFVCGQGRRCLVPSALKAEGCHHD